MESDADLRTDFAGLGRVGGQKHSTAPVCTDIIRRAAKKLSCERLARLHGLVGKISAH